MGSPSLRVIGPGRAGRSLAAGLAASGWRVDGVLGRADDVRPAARGVDLLVIATPDGAVVSVPSDVVEPVRALGTDLDAVSAGIGAVLGQPGVTLFRGVFRWCHELRDLGDAGEWVPTDDPRVPEWLRPFNGDVLVAWDDDGTYGAGVGRKIHDRYGQELAVATEDHLRGRGLAKRLVAQAARRVADEGAVATYLHAPSNVASAHTADAAGFPDVGWQVLGFPLAS